MKKRFKRLTPALCAFALLFTLLPIGASGAGGSPLNVKAPGAVSGNFMQLTNRGNMPPAYYDFGLGFYDTAIALEGRKTAVGVGSDDDGWDFTLSINYMMVQGKIGTEPYIIYTEPRISHEIAKGTEKGVLVYYTGDPEGSQNDPLEQIEEMAGKSKKEAMDAIPQVPFPQTAYMAEFAITGYGHMTDVTQDATIKNTITGYTDTADYDEPMYEDAIIYNVSLTVDDLGYAKAVITLTDALGHPHKWILEGFLGTAQPQKPSKPPRPPK